MFKVKPTVSGITPPSGPVGTAVTINGTGLTHATKVTFNGTFGDLHRELGHEDHGDGADVTLNGLKLTLSGESDQARGDPAADLYFGVHSAGSGYCPLSDALYMYLMAAL